MRDKMVAKMATSKQPEAKKKKKTSQISKPMDEFEMMQKYRIEIEAKRNQFVSAFLPKLIGYGNAIFKVEYVPGALSIHEFNSLLGTKDIKQNQVIGVKYPYMKNKSIMNARVILKSDSIEIGTITKCHGFAAPGVNEKMNIRRTDIRELEMFLLKNYPNLVRLDQNVIKAPKKTSVLIQRIESETSQNECVSKLLPELLNYGNTVFKVEHIPGDLNQREFNKLLGTRDIQRNQVIGVRYPYMKNKSIMNARVILKSDSIDIGTITKFHGFAAPGVNEKMNIRRADIRELEMFLSKNHLNLVRLDQNVIEDPKKTLSDDSTSQQSYNQEQQNCPAPRTIRPSCDQAVVSMDVQNGSQDLSFERSPQNLIIDEPMPPTSPPVVTNINGVDCFVPLTIDTLPYAISIAYKLNVDNRLVFVTFDPCFTNLNLNLNDINRKYSPICGRIDEDCVMIKTNLDKLMPDIKTAYGKEFKRLPRAFIIASKGTDRNDLILKTNQNMLMCGLMTFSCIVMNLKKSTFLMSRNALLRAGAPEASVTPSQVESPVNKESSVRKKMMAKLITPKQPENKEYTYSYPPDEFEKMLKQRVESETNQNEYVSKLLPQLLNYGNTIFKVEHIPGDLNQREFNKLLGTRDIQRNQVIGVRYPYMKNKSIMNARVILKSDSIDTSTITNLHGAPAPGVNEKMNIRRTDIKELEKFLTKNYSKLVILD